MDRVSPVQRCKLQYEVLHTTASLCIAKAANPTSACTATTARFNEWNRQAFCSNICLPSLKMYNLFLELHTYLCRSPMCVSGCNSAWQLHLFRYQIHKKASLKTWLHQWMLASASSCVAKKVRKPCSLGRSSWSPRIVCSNLTVGFSRGNVPSNEDAMNFKMTKDFAQPICSIVGFQANATSHAVQDEDSIKGYQILLTYSQSLGERTGL